jgi:crossover junction endodeoxyribonuclease RuvC
MMMHTLLALDASSTSLGWAVLIDGRPAKAGSYPLRGDYIGQRCVAAEATLMVLYTHFRPDELAIEAPAHHAKPLAMIAQQRVAGVLLLVAEKKRMPVTEIPPSQAKKAFTGNGVASKALMIETAERWSGFTCDEHAADALAVAYTTLILRG